MAIARASTAHHARARSLPHSLNAIALSAVVLLQQSKKIATHEPFTLHKAIDQQEKTG